MSLSGVAFASGVLGGYGDVTQARERVRRKCTKEGSVRGTCELDAWMGRGSMRARAAMRGCAVRCCVGPGLCLAV